MCSKCFGLLKHLTLNNGCVTSSYLNKKFKVQYSSLFYEISCIRVIFALTDKKLFESKLKNWKETFLHFQWFHFYVILIWIVPLIRTQLHGGLAMTWHFCWRNKEQTRLYYAASVFWILANIFRFCGIIWQTDIASYNFS